MKTVRVRSEDDEEVLAFIDEAQITGQLEHPAILPIHEFGRDRAGRLYLSLQIFEGETLDARLRDLGPERMQPRVLGDLLRILVQVCEAVGYAHSRGVAHVGLEPGRVICGRFGQVYVLDWGGAVLLDPPPPDGVQISREGPRPRRVWSADQMPWRAPEQVTGGEVGVHTDVFGIGALLHGMLTGDAPGVDAAEGAWESGGAIPVQLARICQRALSRDPVERYPAVDAMARELEGFLLGTGNIPTVRVTAGEVLVSQGDPVEHAYVVQRGVLQIVRDAAPVRQVVEGECLGERAIFVRGAWPESVVAIEDSELWVVTPDALEEGLGLNTWTGAFVMALVERLEEAEARLRGLHPTS